MAAVSQGSLPILLSYCRADDSLRAVFRDRSEVDFIEVTRAAIDALGTEGPSDLLYSLDYRIEHLLVDEFQDMSYAQYDRLLASDGGMVR